MWAYIKDNKIEQIYQRPKSLVLGEVRYPSNMFTKYTDVEKAAIGIYPVEDSGTKGNDRFENTSQATYTWSASDKKVTTSYTITEKSLVDVERSIYDSSKAIPDAVKTYVAAIKTDCAEIETAIDNASDMTAFKALYVDELNSDGTVKTVARINRWSDDYDVKTYIR